MYDLRGYFGYADIGDRGVESIASVLENNKSVKNLKLNLEGNDISD